MSFDRRAGWLELTAPNGTRWKLTAVPDWVFDYVERGEAIPLEKLPWGVPERRNGGLTSDNVESRVAGD